MLRSRIRQNRILYRRDGLRKLIELHGVDVVARQTELTPRSLLEYAGDSERVIPLVKLEAAKIALANYEHKAGE